MNHPADHFFLRCVIKATSALLVAAIIAPAGPAMAQGTAILEEIIVTATKREERIQDVPISIATLSGDKLASKFAGGETALALAYAVPGVYAESSNGRHAPRFYMRGLGNADFDQAASQPVSIVFDDVPMEQVVLKAFPLFDIDDVEVIRGPQGTLFGRNTTAGIIKFDTRRPTHEPEGFVNASLGTFGNINGEAGYGWSMVEDKLAARVSGLIQHRDDWVSNSFTGQGDALGGFDEVAGRIQFLWTPTDTFSAHFMHQRRDLDSNSASLFRANVLTAGSNDLNGNFDRGTVFYDGGGNNPANIEANGTNLRLDWDIGDVTLTSITSYQHAEQFGRGDIDGGVAGVGPGFILFSSDTGGNNDTQQLTQELRLSSNASDSYTWQVGAFYFDDELTTSTAFGVSATPEDVFTASIAGHQNTTWAVFGQGSYDISDALTVTAGVRYTDDEKDYIPWLTAAPQAPINLSDDNVSWDISLGYSLNDNAQVYGRAAGGFRAPSIQARNAAFGAPVTTALSETITSFEIGYKADLWDRVRLNAAAFTYTIDDMQLTAIGGGGNFTTLLNANEGNAVGFEIDVDVAVTENLILSGGYGYNDTEIDDPTLSVGGCNTTSSTFQRICTLTDPLNANGAPIIDGNPFQHVPEWTLNVELDYNYPMQSGKSLFFYTDWKFKGDTNEFLYESVEFVNDSQFEGGLRFGIRGVEDQWEVAVFGRNITDEENLIGGIDFVNLTGYVNEPRIVGIEGKLTF